MDNYKDGLLQWQVTDFGLMQRFTHIVNRFLNTVIDPNQYQTYCMGGYSDIGEQSLVRCGAGHDGGLRKILF